MSASTNAFRNPFRSIGRSRSSARCPSGRSSAGLVVVSTGSPALLLGFFAGIAVWIVGYPATPVAAGRRSDAFEPVVAYASALVLAMFGVLFVSDATSTLLG